MNPRKSVIFAPLAKSDLREIGRYIGRDNLSRARSFIRELQAKCLMLAGTPEAFPARDALGAGLRVALHGRYVIYYRDLPGQDLVRIERILHGARDARRLLT